MDYRQLGRSGLRVSPLALGTVNIGWLADEAESFSILHQAVEAGINLIDTSDNYNAGATEECIGRWLARGDGRRDRIVLATKCYSPPMKWSSIDPRERQGLHAGPNDRGLSALHIRRACEASLRRLQTDHIDLYQMHHVDRATPIEEIWQAMETLVAQGKVTYVGSSNFAGWHIARASETARTRNFFGLACEQSPYNLDNRMVELEVLPACREYGLGFLAYSPLGAGLLAGGAIGGDAGQRRRFAGLRLDDTARARIVRYEELCAEADHAPAEVALAWVMQREGVTAPIIGPRTVEQLKGSLAVLDMVLDADLVPQLDRIFPGPGGPAPEAYAW